MRTLNLGILAHVDAGKTSLTERLLFAAGAIDEIGSVDEGSTRTDTLALERQRGITNKSAVVSFVVDDLAAARVHELQQQLPSLSRGEGALECVFARYLPVRGPIPTRPRSDFNALNRKEYMLHLARRIQEQRAEKQADRQRRTWTAVRPLRQPENPRPSIPAARPPGAGP